LHGTQTDVAKSEATQNLVIPTLCDVQALLKGLDGLSKMCLFLQVHWIKLCLELLLLLLLIVVGVNKP
jgi:hypothetical protein